MDASSWIYDDCTYLRKNKKKHLPLKSSSIVLKVRRTLQLRLSPKSFEPALDFTRWILFAKVINMDDDKRRVYVFL